jgi:protocatechuate 3,4-dioxygenase beta subunit
MICWIWFFLSAAFLSANGSISGIISGADKTPLPSATLALYKGTKLIAETTTGFDGSYLFNDLIADSYLLQVSLSGYEVSVNGAIVNDGEMTNVDVTLLNGGGTLSGQVNDGNNLPVVGSKVNVIRSNILIASATTDSLGKYAVQGLPGGFYSVVASSPELQSSCCGVSIISDGEAQLDFSLKGQGGGVIGVVTDDLTGLPVSECLVQVLKENLVIQATTSDELGKYSLSGLDSGNYWLEFIAPIFSASSTWLKVNEGEMTPLNISLSSPPGRIKGQVADSNGNPLRGACVLLNSDYNVLLSSLTDESGNYQFSGVNPGNYPLHVQRENYRGAYVNPVAVSENEATIANFSLNSNPGKIIGSIYDEGSGAGLKGATISLFENNVLIANVLTDDVGGFVIDALADDGYTFSANKEGYDNKSIGIYVLQGQTLQISFSLKPSP